jgi:hypothetical protein
MPHQTSRTTQWRPRDETRHLNDETFLHHDVTCYKRDEQVRQPGRDIFYHDQGQLRPESREGPQAAGR